MKAAESKNKKRLSARFRRFNILVFLLALSVMAAVTIAVFGSIISKISIEYAKRYAASSENSLSTHIAKEVSLLYTAANSAAVIDWLIDEQDTQKQDRAYMELSSTINALYSSSLYITPVKTYNEYKVEGDYPYGGITLVDTLDAGDVNDRWFFDTLVSQQDYKLAIAVDEVAYGKRVWIDHKIIAEGEVIGVIATGLEFPHIAGELFAHFDNETIHGAVINGEGIVYINSSLMDDDSFLRNEFTTSYESVYTQPAINDAISRYLDKTGGYYNDNSPIEIINLEPQPYRYATITPVRYTDWLIVITYDSGSLLDIPLFLPAAAAAIAVLVFFAVAVNAVSSRLIFSPLDKLRRSLSRLKEENAEDVYGSEREDEIGELSGAIRDWFTKANYDALTGIYNRRYMENSLQSIMGVLSRSGSMISFLMMDVDFFKKYNDTYGHEQGDACLKSVARAIASCAMRSGDFAARYGGEEFVLILPDTDKAGACLIAEKVVSSVRNLKLPHQNSSAADIVTISVGVTSAKAEYGHNWEDYLKRADEALYTSKQNGRNRYTFLD